VADYGIDVSSYNTIASWPAVRGVPNTWAWCKATQGGGYTNPRFVSQFTGAAAAGLAAGAYHFADPNVSVAANVSHFVAIAGAVGAFSKGAFVPLLDIENDTVDGINWTAAGANAFIAAFRDQLRAATGQRKLCVYASQSWFSSGFLRPNDWADQDVFLCAARYGFSPGNVGWSHPRLAVHQYTDGTAQFGSTLYSTDRSVLLAPFTRDQLTIGGGVSPAVTTTPGDIVFEFVCDVSTPSSSPYDPKTGFKQVRRLAGAGLLESATWADVCAKDKSYGGDGTGSVLGLEPADFAAVLATDALVRGALKNMSSLAGAGGSGAAPTYDIAIQPGDVVIAKAYPEKS
jgi:lysozyme